MNDVANPSMSDYAHFSLLDRLAVWCGWAVAVALFYSLGWMALAPRDPLGAVSLFGRGQAWSVLLQAAGLAAVAAAIATVVSGRQLVWAGPFAAALGLAVVTLRGETAEYVLLAAVEGSVPPAKAVASAFALESVAWLLVILVAVAVSGVVARWCLGRTGDVFHKSRTRASATDGPYFTVVAAVASLIAFDILTTGLERRAIQHGQVCFVVAASVWLGCFLAHRIVAVRSVIWSILAVGLLAVGGYLWAGMHTANPRLPPSVPASHFLRVLPVQFISVGAAAAIAAYWSMLRRRATCAGEDEGIDATRVGEGRR